MENMVKVSVITITNRPGGIDMAWASLRKQTFQDFEWILVDELFERRAIEVVEYVASPRLYYMQAVQKDPEKAWNLSACYNFALLNARGKIVVSLQDYIWIPGDGLQRFVTAIEEMGEVFITGVGHKAERPGKEDIVDPDGPVTIFGKPFEGRPEGIKERDGRIDGGTGIVETNYSFFELNWSAFPMRVAEEIGGFDEEMDRVYGGENINFALRAHLAGHRIFMDKSNECVGIHHQSIFPRPADWEIRHANKSFYAERAREFLSRKVDWNVRRI